MPKELELTEKLEILMSLAAEDREGPPASSRSRCRLDFDTPTTPVRSGHSTSACFEDRAGRCKLLRILMTNACALNCHYCPMRRDRAMRRTLLKPEELVRIFLGALRRAGARGCSSRPASPRARRKSPTT